MKNFRTLDIAVEFYKESQNIPIKGHLKDQLNRASLSISLNIAEGSARTTRKDQLRFYNIAFSSLKEVQTLLSILEMKNSPEWKLLDKLAAHLYKLKTAASN